MTRLASIIAGLVAVAMLLCSPGCVSGPAFEPTGGVLRGASHALRKVTSFPGSAENESSRLHGQLSLARLSERGGEYDQARNLYARYLLQKPDDPAPYHRLAVIAARERQYDKAEEYFQKARSMAPPTSELLSDLGYFYYLQNRLSDAEKVLQLAVEQDPEHAGANNNLGLVLGEQGRFTESFNAFQRAVSPAEAHANLAFVMAQVGEHRRALEHYSQALTLQEDLRPAAEAMVHLTEQGKKKNQAAADSSTSLDEEAVRQSVVASPTSATNPVAGPNRLPRQLSGSTATAVEPSGRDDADISGPASTATLQKSQVRMPRPDSAPLTSTTREPSVIANANYFREQTSGASPVTTASGSVPSPIAEDWTTKQNGSSSTGLFRRLLAPRRAAGTAETPPAVK